MLILSHRGYWKNKSEQNTHLAFQRSFTEEFGTETDIRDQSGELVIAHNMAKRGDMLVADFFCLYQNCGMKLPLALNIKADGLQIPLQKLLADYNIEDYFVFDMSIPDTIGYLKKGLRFFSRQSEYEKDPIFYEHASGIWLDSFTKSEISSEKIQMHVANGKQVCLVSPELHGRPHEDTWAQYRAVASVEKTNKLMICTDFPKQAQEFFCEAN